MITIMLSLAWSMSSTTWWNQICHTTTEGWCRAWCMIISPNITKSSEIAILSPSVSYSESPQSRKTGDLKTWSYYLCNYLWLDDVLGRPVSLNILPNNPNRQRFSLCGGWSVLLKETRPKARKLAFCLSRNVIPIFSKIPNNWQLQSTTECQLHIVPKKSFLGKTWAHHSSKKVF